MLPVDLLSICEILQFFESKVEVSRLELALVSSEVQDVTEGPSCSAARSRRQLRDGTTPDRAGQGLHIGRRMGVKSCKRLDG